MIFAAQADPPSRPRYAKIVEAMTLGRAQGLRLARHRQSRDGRSLRTPFGATRETGLFAMQGLDLAALLDAAGLDPTGRAEEVDAAGFCALARAAEARRRG